MAKLEDNRKRDARIKIALRRLGWKVLVVWECQTADLPALTHRLTRFLEEDR
jgi:DNA mismatch endonuclease (patch repair protein)